MNALERALRFTWSATDELADEVRSLTHGTVLRTPSLPYWWSANAVRLEGPQPHLDLAGAEALASAHVPTPYRHLAVEHDATADRLGAAARAEGWTVEHELLMARRGGADRPPPAAEVRDGSRDEILTLMDLWLGEEYAGHGAGVVDALRGATRRQHERQPWRRWVAVDPGGHPAAMCSLLAGDGVAQVEDVFTRPDARGAGLARAVVCAAVDAARRGGHDLVFLVADDDGWPKHLYAKLGFAPIGRRASLHRDG